MVLQDNGVGILEYWKNACPVKCDEGVISTGECWNISLNFKMNFQQVASKCEILEKPAKNMYIYL